MIRATRYCARCEMNWDHVSSECESCGAPADIARVKRHNWDTAEVA